MKTKPLHAFIMIYENGESYSDYQEWTVGVWRSLRGALKAYNGGVQDVQHGAGVFRHIEEWKGAVCLGQYDEDGEKTWPTANDLEDK